MRVDSTKVLVAEVTPGFVNSGLFAEVDGVINQLINKIFARSLGEGARLYVHAVLSTKDEEFHGGYWRSGVPATYVIFSFLQTCHIHMISCPALQRSREAMLENSSGRICGSRRWM